MIKVGKVVAVDEKTCRCRVQLEDNDGVVTYWLPIIVNKSQKDKFYWLPDIGEEVLCAFLEHGIEQGFVLGAIYNEKDTVPVVSKDKYHIRFEDGTTIEYDRKSHKLSINCVGDVEIVAQGNIKIVGTRIDLNP
ncbi:phage baseplate assembly protein V [Sulfurihydrogenibium sp.]|jgi:phage baseplate assembly protein V|uniref:phage baseplate assembly protein V n=1 Tax=Sulfurihydrogenibium sp. TaxID=2053621 RepID=UPI0026112CF4|nr:phage baseplate assembly protein V [Sulfurihydrogenibium sp.]